MADTDNSTEDIEPTADLQAEIDQLTAELADATARANALDVRCAAAERLAAAATAAQLHGQVLRVSGSELTGAIELWQRAAAAHPSTRARDYSDAVMQLAELRHWTPELDDNYRRAVSEHAAHWGQTPAEWIADTIAQHLAEYGMKRPLVNPPEATDGQR